MGIYEHIAIDMVIVSVINMSYLYVVVLMLNDTCMSCILILSCRNECRQLHLHGTCRQLHLHGTCRQLRLRGTLGNSSNNW